MAGVVTGEDAKFYLGLYGAGAAITTADHMASTVMSNVIYGVSDFSLTFDRDTVEQELIGQKGNYFAYGALSIDGSFTACKFASSGNANALISLVESRQVLVSGATETNELSWTFRSGQVTSYEVSFGDATTITEASIDFTVLNPSAVAYYSGGRIADYTLGAAR